jgi:hypothetical protein
VFEQLNLSFELRDERGMGSGVRVGEDRQLYFRQLELPLCFEQGIGIGGEIAAVVPMRNAENQNVNDDVVFGSGVSPCGVPSV